MGHAELSRVGGHRAMQATFAAPVEHTDDFSSMSFAELESLADDLSESSQWSLLDDVRAEIATRVDEAKDALKRLFIERCDNGSTLPMVIGEKLVQVDVAEIVRETMSTNWGTNLGAELVLHAHSRASVIARMAADFAELCCEDNLRAGWTE